LLGRRIGCFPAGSCQDTILRKWLSENDINLSKVSIVPMGPGEAFWAMSQGSLDGVFVPQPGSAMIELNGIGKSVKASGDIWPNHACCGIAVSGIMIREHPDLVMQIVKTSINATDYINTHPDEAARIYSNRTGQDLNMIISSIDTWDGRWISDPHRLINDTLEFARLQYGLNYTQKMLTEKDLFDTRFYDKVTA
jgi:sulfonate transport system substrate-binding protein